MAIDSSFSQFHREYVGRNTPNATHMWPVHRFLSPPSPPLTLRNDVDVRCPGTTLAGAGRCWHSNLGLCFLSPQKHQSMEDHTYSLGLTLKCELEMRAFRWPLVLDNLTHSNPFMSQTIVICFACSNGLFALGSFVTFCNIINAPNIVPCREHKKVTSPTVFSQTQTTLSGKILGEDARCARELEVLLGPKRCHVTVAYPCGPKNHVQTRFESKLVWRIPKVQYLKVPLLLLFLLFLFKLFFLLNNFWISRVKLLHLWPRPLRPL